MEYTQNCKIMGMIKRAASHFNNSCFIRAAINQGMYFCFTRDIASIIAQEFPGSSPDRNHASVMNIACLDMFKIFCKLAAEFFRLTLNIFLDQWQDVFSPAQCR